MDATSPQDDGSTPSRQIEGIPLADAEPPPRRPQPFRAQFPNPVIEDSSSEDRQFSVAGLLLLVTLAAVLLAPLRLLPPHWYAALLGLLSLLGLLLMAAVTRLRLEVRIAWWSVLVMYLIACCAAWLRIGS